MPYATRNDAFSPPTTWHVEPTGIRLEAQGRPDAFLPFADLAEVRLEFAPTRPERGRHRCRLTRHDGSRVECFDRTWQGLYDVAPTPQAYVAFVEELHGALLAAGWTGRWAAGATRGAYVAGALGLGVALLALLALGLGFLFGGAPLLALLHAVVTVVYLPTAWRWMRRNRPSTYDPRAIPTDVLPRVAG